jgi:proteasome accessory factor A
MYTVTRDIKRVVKLCGQDAELVNYCTGVSYAAGGNAVAANAVLAEVDGLPRPAPAILPLNQAGQVRDWEEEDEAYGYGHEPYSSPVCVYYGGGAKTQGSGGGAGSISYNPQDVGRRYLRTNGGCMYIDLNHIELAQSETRDAFMAAACWHAMLRTTRDALRAANARRPAESPIEVVVSNTDFQGHSCGSHVNILVSGACWDSLFRRRLKPLLYYSSYKATAMVIAGQGKVGSENGMPWSPFQIHQRADFLETLVGVQTTYNRPLNNTRSEPLCGGLSHRQYHPRPDTYARIHEIAFDHNISHTACALKFGMLQLVTSMIEASEISAGLLLEDPLEALYVVSHDPDLNARVPLCDGRRLTAVEMQRCFFEDAARFAAAGGFDEVVPRAADVLALWVETLTLRERRDWPALAARRDWVR